MATILPIPRIPPAKDLRLLRDLLLELPAGARAALAQYYVQELPERMAIAGTNLSLDEFRKLRAGFRARFFARTGRLAS